MSVRRLFGAMSVVAFAAGATAANEKVTGGAPSNDGHAALVLVQQEFGVGFCSGVQIARDWVLTAPSCFPDDGNPMEVRFGTDALADPDPEHSYAVIARVEHPDYDSQSNAKSALLLQVDRPIASRSPVLDPDAFPTSDGRTIRFAGYGYTSTADGGSQHSADILVRRESELLATDPAGDEQLCIGDAGGPIFDETTHHLAGIAVGGIGQQPGRVECSTSSFFEPLDQVIEFIRDNVDVCESTEPCATVMFTDSFEPSTAQN